MNLGEMIRQARTNQNISQEELAEQLGVSRQAVSKWENGIAVPHGNNREKLNQILKLDVLAADHEQSEESQAVKSGLWHKRTGMIFLAGLGLVSGIMIGAAISRIAGKENNTIENQMQEQDDRKIIAIDFYDADVNRVYDTALWYNMAQIDYMVVSWSGDSPSAIELYITPAGSETAEDTQLVMTKPVEDGAVSLLLPLSSLKSDGMSAHLTVTLNYGESAVSYGDINILCDEALAEEE